MNINKNQVTIPTKKRSSNIDLLRILAIIAVIIIHYINDDIGGGNKYVSPHSLNQLILFAIQSLTVSAVNVFVILSGFCSYKRESLNLAKPLKLLITLYAFRIMLLFVSVFITHEQFAPSDIFIRLLPNNWYIILFIVLTILSPSLNLFLRELGEYKKVFILVAFILFAVWPTLTDLIQNITSIQVFGMSSVGIYGSMDGYTIVNFVLLYLIGASIHSCNYKEKEQNIKTLLLKLLVVYLAIVFWSYLYPLTGLRLHKSAWSYCNPLLIYEAYLIVMLFTKLRIPSSKLISYLANGTLTVFILHTSLLVRIDTCQAVNGSAWYMLFHIVVVALAVFGICMIVHVVWDFASRWLWRYLDKKKWEIKIQ